MSDITLSKTETGLLVAAASAGGLLVTPDGIKPATRTRLVGRFERDALIITDEAGHHLTPAGYRAIGLRPPRRAKSEHPAGNRPAERSPSSTVAPPGSKQTVVLGLLGRGEGATVPELMSATGWLPHTTRAALSRLRSAGKELLKSARPDGRTAYRIAADEVPSPKRVRARGKPSEHGEAEAA